MLVTGLLFIIAGAIYIKKPEWIITASNYIKKISDKSTMFYNVRTGVLLIILGFFLVIYSLKII